MIEDKPQQNQEQQPSEMQWSVLRDPLLEKIKENHAKARKV